jgi:hypothetical protein
VKLDHMQTYDRLALPPKALDYIQRLSHENIRV